MENNGLVAGLEPKNSDITLSEAIFGKFLGSYLGRFLTYGSLLQSMLST